MVPATEFEVSVVYATPTVQTVVSVSVSAGTTVAQAVQRSGLSRVHPDIGAEWVVGVFGRVVPPDTRLMPGDRVEIYRPLLADPKDTRRELAKRGRTMARTPMKTRR